MKTSFDVYPNPTKDLLTFDLLNTSNQISEIRIHDVQGKLIQTLTNFEEQLVTISTKSLTSGLYIVKIMNSEGNSSIRKLIVE